MNHLDYNTLCRMAELFNRGVNLWTYEEFNWMHDVLGLRWFDLHHARRLTFKALEAHNKRITEVY